MEFLKKRGSSNAIDAEVRKLDGIECFGSIQSRSRKEVTPGPVRFRMNPFVDDGS